MFLGNLILYVQPHMYLYIGFAWLTLLYCTQYLQCVGDKNSRDCYYVHISNKLPSRYRESSGTTFTYICNVFGTGGKKEEKSACDLFTPKLTNSRKIALHIASSMVYSRILHLDFHKIMYESIFYNRFCTNKIEKDIYTFPSAMP